MIDRLIKHGVSIKNQLIRYRTKKIDNVQYYFDDLITSDSSIYIKGWILSMSGEHINPSILFKTVYKSQCFDLKLTKREDVINATGCKSVECGFQFEANFKSNIAGRIYLQYIYKGKVRKIVIGAFEGDSHNKTLQVNKIISGIAPYSHIKNSIICNQSYIPQDIYNYTVDIIVPVYNGFEYFDNLFETISKTHMTYNLFIINDCSPDERVMPYLVNYAKDKRNVILLENHKNLGFVQTVNKALSISNCDAVIVNTDVILPENWLERLMLPIIMRNDIASSTPFTNSGTICSFPNFCDNNDIFLDLDVDTIDKEFSKINPIYNEMPTGVGFCMGMKRNVINKIGQFNADVFYKGYGEENDWCQRAIKSGYKNVMVENLFVWHKHGGSFLSDDKKRYIERNLKLLSEMHPNYNNDVQIYCKRDPVKNIREYVKWNLINSEANENYIIFNHNWGGGAITYINDKIKSYMEDGIGVIEIIYDINCGLIVEYSFGGYKSSFSFENFNEIYDIIKDINCKGIIINELVSFDNIEKTMDFILKLKKQFNTEITMLCHDFYAVCPSIYLINNEDRHCFKTQIEECRRCFSQNKNKFYNSCVSIDKWRELWKSFLAQCDEVRVFSNNTKLYFEHWFGKFENMTIVPHDVSYINEVNAFEKTNNTLTIAIIGNLMKTKGADIIYEMSRLIKQDNINARIVVIGPDLDNCSDKNIIIHGKYKREELPLLIEKYQADVVFIASIWPETFSYTTEEAIKMNVPVASFNIGAPAERLTKYNKGIIIDEISATAALKQIIKYINRIK